MKPMYCIPILASIAWSFNASEMKPIPAGSFEMGDHAGLGGGDTKHPSDEVPLHTLQMTAFSMGQFEVTNSEYVEFLNDAWAKSQIQVNQGWILWKATGDTLTLDNSQVDYSQLTWDGQKFAHLSGKERHPIANMRWKGAIAYCNWLSQKLGLDTVYDMTSGTANFSKNGIRLPSEAEWEYAALGGLQNPYAIFPWGNDSSQTGKRANWQNSGDPYESGNYPWTTPVGFYNGQTHLKSELNWPGSAESFATLNSVNGYGLYDLSGNVWEYVNDWYLNPYYGQSPAVDPEGPTEAAASTMPDGKKYKTMRGGNWYNGAEYFGHGRNSNRNPSYFRGPQDPSHPYYHIGFRIATRSQFEQSTAVQINSPLQMIWSYDFVKISGILPHSGILELKVFGIQGQVLAHYDLGAQGPNVLLQKSLFVPTEQSVFPKLYLNHQEIQFQGVHP